MPALRRGGGDGADLRNTWQVVAGSILVPLGVVFILMSWFGAAHTSYVQQQIPYLVSGSFVGLGCMVLGGLLYWAHWLYRIYDQADLHHEEQIQALHRTLLVIAERLGPPSDGRSPAAGTWAPPNGAAPGDRHGTASGGPGTTYVRTEAGGVFHDPSCPVVAHHAEGVRPVSEGDLGGLEACRICRPG
jgi:hypothetical protein